MISRILKLLSHNLIIWLTLQQLSPLRVDYTWVACGRHGNLTIIIHLKLQPLQWNNQGRRSCGLVGSRPPEMWRKGQSMFWPFPLKCHSFVQNCCFRTSRMNSWTLSPNSLILLMLTRLPALCLISSKQTVSSNECLCCSTRLKDVMAQNKSPKRGCRWFVVDNPHRSWLTCCPPHDWSSTARVAHQVRRSWGWGPPWMCHIFSFKNCCCITASFTASRITSMNLLMLMMLSSSCLISAKQCPPINVFAAILGLKISSSKGNGQLQNVGAGDSPSTILIDGVSVERVEEFIYLGSKQSSNDYCR